MINDYSIWEHEAHHTFWDVCIIGSGINGISTGISILEKRPKAKVLIIDRWFIPLGASTRNAGFSCFGSPSEIMSDISMMGEANAMELVRKRWSGLQILQSRLNGSNAQFENHGGYELYNEDEYERIFFGLTYLNQLMESVTGKQELFQPVPVPDGIRNFSNAIYNQFEGQLHPAFMMEHLTSTFLSLGGKIRTGMNIDHIEEQKDHIAVSNKLAVPVKSKFAIVTTNAFAKELIPGLDIQPARNHVLVTGPFAQLPWKGCYHYDKGYFYFRNIGNRILIGGARNKDLINEYTDQFGTNEKVIRELKQFLFEHLVNEDACRIDYQWSGIIAVGSQKMPIVKAISHRLFAGVRCSGMGIALAGLIGEELSEMVLQQDE